MCWMLDSNVDIVLLYKVVFCGEWLESLAFFLNYQGKKFCNKIFLVLIFLSCPILLSDRCDASFSISGVKSFAYRTHFIMSGGFILSKSVPRWLGMQPLCYLSCFILFHPPGVYMVLSIPFALQSTWHTPLFTYKQFQLCRIQKRCSRFIKMS